MTVKEDCTCVCGEEKGLWKGWVDRRRKKVSGTAVLLFETPLSSTAALNQTGQLLLALCRDTDHLHRERCQKPS